MATNSIYKSVSISGEEKIAAFLEALEKASKIPQNEPSVPHSTATSEDIKRIFRSKRN